jgi:hypothetical protein
MKLFCDFLCYVFVCEHGPLEWPSLIPKGCARCLIVHNFKTISEAGEDCRIYNKEKGQEKNNNNKKHNNNMKKRLRIKIF